MQDGVRITYATTCTDKKKPVVDDVMTVPTVLVVAVEREEQSDNEKAQPRI